MPHAFVLQGNVYGPSGPITDTTGVPLAAADADAYNAAVTAQELAHWATAPERFAPAYYHFPAGADARVNRFAELRQRPYEVCVSGETAADDARVTTWTGAVLGKITRARVYRHNFGGRFVSLWVRGNNGAWYHGRASYDNGSVIRLHRCKP